MNINKKAAAAAILVISVTILSVFVVVQQAERHLQLLEEELEVLMHLLYEVEEQQKQLEKEVERHHDAVRQRQEDDELLMQKLKQWLDNWSIDIYEATGYAPFDSPDGICHDGNPGVTATGTQTGPGTVAVDPEVIPYGTSLWIEGYGWGSALDTGAAMRSQHKLLDVFFWTRAEAFEWGRREVVVIHEK